MSGPWIEQTDDRIGFTWVSSSGRPASLVDVVAEPGSEVERLLPTHLEALDDVLVDAAGRVGGILGGSRPPASPQDWQDLQEVSAVLDRLCVEYADAAERTGFPVDVRAGQIVGTAALLAIRTRMVLGVADPVPLAGQLDDPSVGVVAGYGDMVQVNESEPFRGGRWVIRTESGQRFPATLSMLLYDSSGVNKDAAQDEHRAAVRSVLAAVDDEGAEPAVVGGALDWLLHDWLMAHRDGPDSAAVSIPARRTDDAVMIVTAVTAVAASARLRDDPGRSGGRAREA